MLDRIKRLVVRLASGNRVCPLCGGLPTDQWSDFLVCTSCGEMLEPHELVRVATRRTKLRYCRSNFDSDTYPDN